MSSCISSGATSLRDHDSSQRGFGCATGAVASSYLPALDEDRGPSLERKTFLRNGMGAEGLSTCGESARRRGTRGMRSGAGAGECESKRSTAVG
jgi:hypothetical protein